MQDGKYLTFELSGQSYAIEITCVKEILNGCGSISPVPEFPEYGKGVVNLRGDIVPIIDMRIRLHLPATDQKGKICIIVTESKAGTGADYIGYVVDRVNAVEDFTGADISPSPKLTSAGSNYFTGVYKADDSIIMIIDPDELLTESMKSAIGQYMDGVSPQNND